MTRDELVRHLMEDHGIDSWYADIPGEDIQLDHHARLHARPRKMLTHTHESVGPDVPEPDERRR